MAGGIASAGPRAVGPGVGDRAAGLWTPWLSCSHHCASLCRRTKGQSNPAGKSAMRVLEGAGHIHGLFARRQRRKRQAGAAGPCASGPRPRGWGCARNPAITIWLTGAIYMCWRAFSAPGSCDMRKERDLAGVVGFEPTIHGTKNRCLTTWLHPSNAGLPSQMALGSQAQKHAASSFHAGGAGPVTASCAQSKRARPGGRALAKHVSRAQCSRFLTSEIDSSIRRFASAAFIDLAMTSPAASVAALIAVFRTSRSAAA